ncbi:MAG TPA: phosphate ABC transporter substrate-binding protein [Nitrospiraceae bacterium]|nr:phosphate ABC transporter substrate-binding protein [Nitrospiraceae bacterium]
MNKILIYITFVTFLLTFNSSASTEELIVGAGQAPTANILKPIEEHFEKATGIDLVIITRSPKDALMLLEAGTVEAALGGLSFEDWMKYMKQEEEEIKDPSGLWHMSVGEDKIKVLIHKDNPVSKLTKEQLKGIFNGKITSWNELGGEDIPIAVVWTKNLGGNVIFTKKILDIPLLRKDMSEVEDSQFAKALVKSNPGAIAISPLGIIDDTIKSPETPEIKRPITIITQGEPSPNVQKLINFIRGEGQKYIKQ